MILWNRNWISWIYSVDMEQTNSRASPKKAELMALLLHG